jgi:serine phosphatase RsbU (regulator of sigma subunit)
MRIRTKLILIFLLLAVVPLTGIVFYNYWSSLQTFREAVRREVTAEAGELAVRLDTAKEDLGRSLRALGTFSLQELAVDEAPEVGEATLAFEFGELAPLVETVEVIPAAPVEPAVVAPPDIPSELHLSEGSTLDFAESIVIYVDQALEAAEASGVSEEQLAEARQATEELLGQIEVGLEAAADLAAEEERLEGELATREDEVEALGEAIRDRRLSPEQRQQLRQQQEAARTALRAIARERGRLEREEVEALQSGRERAHKLLGSRFDWQILSEGRVLGEVRAQVSPENLLSAVLSRSRLDQGEIPFALDGDGEIYTVSPEDRERIAELDATNLDQTDDNGTRMAFRKDWLLVASPDPDSEVVLGIARPIGESLSSMRRTAARNFGLGLGMITLALVGIMPLSGRMTRNLTKLSRGVDQMAAGNLDVKVDVRTRDEIGQLATSVNRMADDLQRNQEKLIDEVQRRKEQETREQLLAAENERKSAELEEARRFQLSLLPAKLPDHPELEIEVHMQTATEVGGDYYDFLPGHAGALTIAIGDATGHGATAGTMVTAIKSLFMARGADVPPDAFLSESSEAVKRMNLGRMAMALTITRFDGEKLTLAAAGMPPALLWRHATDEVEEVELTGPPLGGLVGAAYEQAEVPLRHGDVLLLMTDGFPELPNPAGDPLGYVEVRRCFGSVARDEPAKVIAALNDAAYAWRQSQPLIDDITFVVVRRRA